MNLWETIFLFFGFQAFVLAVVFLFKKKGDRTANRLMALYVALFGYNIFFNVLYWTKNLYTLDWINLNLTSLLIWVLYGPILFFYVRRLIFETRFTIRDLIHFIPFLILFINYSPGYFLPASEKLELIKAGRSGELMYYLSPYMIIVILVLMLFYFGAIYFNLSRGTKSFNKSRWIISLAYSYLGYVLSFASYFILSRLGYMQIEYDYIIGFSMIFFIGLLTSFAYLQPQVFEGVPLKKLIPFIKYEKTGLTYRQAKELKDKLVNIMENEKPYLRSDLRLDNLAERMTLSRHQTSQLINEQFDSRFFDFINKYRIEESKKLLNEENSLSVTDILYACGFNNRVSFYKAFKKNTGKTPTTFRTSDRIAS